MQRRIGISRTELKQLLKLQAGDCASIFIPLPKSERSRREYEIHVKDISRELEARLGREHGVARAARDLLASSDFWRSPAAGLVLYVSEAGSRYFYLERDPGQAEIRVGSEFFLRPVLGSLFDYDRIWVLVMSRERVRLFEAAGNEVREVEVPEQVPRSLKTMRKYTEAIGGQRPQQYHTGTSGGTNASGPARAGERRAMFHAQDEVRDQHRDLLETFANEVVSGFQPLLEERGWPVAFAGAEELGPALMRQLPERFRTPFLLRASAESVSEAELARVLGEALHRWQEDRASAEFERARNGSQRVSQDLDEILTAADQGRIESLFVIGDQPVWGRADERAVSVHGEPMDGDADLINLAVVRTARTGGLVRYLPTEHPMESALSGRCLASIR